MYDQSNLPPVQPPPAAPAGQHTSTLAIISLIGGIAGWTFVPLLGSIVAVITGHMAKNEIKKNAGMVTGNGLATAGLVLGYAALVIGICACLVYGGFMIWAISQGQSYNTLY